MAENYRHLLEKESYICEELLATSLEMAESLSRPLLIEGEAGVGKTYLGKALSKATGKKLIRLQCYEGLDFSHAIYEWNYQKQILAIASARDKDNKHIDANLFSEDFLLHRPLLQAIMRDEPAILLIDEIDRADEEFEAYLLEILSDYQVSIPELGTIVGRSKPFTILTSNGTRELSDALRRRCLFHYIDFPDISTEIRIIRSQVPECSARLAADIAGFISQLRKEDLVKKPGIAETLDWTAALVGADIQDIRDDVEAVHRTLLCVLKTREDRDAVPVAIFQKLVG